jgi:hypothetical protein
MTETMIRTRESTENIPSARRVRDVWDRFLYVDPDAAPFTLVTKNAGSRVATNPKYEWFEKNRAPKWDAVNNGAGYNATATSIVVDNGAYFFPNDVINVPRTGEKIRVVSVSSNTLTVVRAVDGDGTTGSAILDNDDLQIIGQAFAEGAALGTERTNTESAVFNYSQIFRWPFGATRTQSDSETYGGKTRARLRAEGAVDHAIQIEEAFLFGERNLFTTGDSDATTNKPRRYTGGLLYFLTANIVDAGGILTEPELENWAQNVFNATASGDTRLVLASPLVCSVIDQLAMARLVTVPKEKTYGVTIMQFVTSHGTFLLAKDRLLENGSAGVNGALGNGYGGYAIAVDPKKVQMRPFTNATTKLRMDVGVAGDDGFTDEYLTECGLQVENPICHGVLKNVTG